MSHDSIEMIIRQAKEQRAKEIAEVCALALNTLGRFAYFSQAWFAKHGKGHTSREYGPLIARWG